MGACSSNVPEGTHSAHLADSFAGEVAARLLPLMYDDLRRLAGARIARLGPGQTLTPTELVHEAYLRVSGRNHEGLGGRRHLFFLASRAMRDILVESARRKASRKRGGGYVRVADSAEAGAADRHMSFLELDLALRKLECESPERAQVVLLSYFGGFTHGEIAEVLGLSLTTVERRWCYCRAWLRREISQGSNRQPRRGHGAC